MRRKIRQLNSSIVVQENLTDKEEILGLGTNWFICGILEAVANLN